MKKITALVLAIIMTAAFTAVPRKRNRRPSRDRRNA